MSKITHRELCELGAKYMYKNGTIAFNKPKYVVCELERIGECPDVFGFGFAFTQLLEIKNTSNKIYSLNLNIMFKYSCFIENTPEAREWLESVGYVKHGVERLAMAVNHIPNI